MALMTTGNTFQDAVVGAFKALFNAAEKEVSQRLEYTGLGYADDTIAIPNEQRNQVTGPSAGVLTLEGVEYGDVEKFRGFPVTVNPRKFSLKYTFSEEVLHWLQMASSTNMVTNEITNAASDLVSSLYQNVDSNAADVLYLGFGTTSSVNGNGTVGNSEALARAIALLKSFLMDLKSQFKKIGQQGASKLNKLCSVNEQAKRLPPVALKMEMRCSELGL